MSDAENSDLALGDAVDQDVRLGGDEFTRPRKEARPAAVREMSQAVAGEEDLFGDSARCAEIEREEISVDPLDIAQSRSRPDDSHDRR